MGTEKALYRRWISELWAGEPVTAELVSGDFVGHWPNRDVHGPDELQAMVDDTRTTLTDLRFVGNDILRFAGGRFVEYSTGTSTG
jgi:trans-aconitate methyltransferase